MLFGQIKLWIREFVLPCTLYLTIINRIYIYTIFLPFWVWKCCLLTLWNNCLPLLHQFSSPYNYIKQVCIFTSNCGLEIKFCICWCLASNFIYIRTDGSRWMTLALAMYCTRKYLPQKTIKSTWHWSCVGGKLTIIIVFIHLFVSVKKYFVCSS